MARDDRLGVSSYAIEFSERTVLQLMDGHHSVIAIAKALGQRVKADRGLLECDFGDWTGRELKQLVKLPEWQTVQRLAHRQRGRDDDLGGKGGA